MVADVNAKWELFASLVWALLNNLIFIVIVLFVIWSLVKTTEFDKKIKRLISSEIERKILARDIKQTWFKVKKNPLEDLDRFKKVIGMESVNSETTGTYKAQGIEAEKERQWRYLRQLRTERERWHFTMDNVLHLSLLFWGSMYVIGLLAVVFKGPWVILRFGLGLPLTILGSLGLGITLILSGIRKSGIAFLKNALYAIAMWLVGTFWGALSLIYLTASIVTTTTVPARVITGTAVEVTLLTSIIIGLVGSILFLIPWSMIALGAASQRASEGFLDSVSNKAIIHLLLVLLVFAGFFIPMLTAGDTIPTYVGLFLILGGSITALIVLSLWAYLHGGVKSLIKFVYASLVLIVGLFLIMWALVSIPSLSVTVTSGVGLALGGGLGLILIGHFFMMWGADRFIHEEG